MIFSLLLYFVNIPLGRELLNLFQRLTLPVYYLKAKVSDTVSNYVRTYILLVDARRENELLKREVESLKLYKAQLDSCRISLEKVGISTGNTGSTRCGVIGYDPKGEDSFIYIDKGRNVGLEDGFIVFYGDKFVGLVQDVFGGHAKVSTTYSNKLFISCMLLKQDPKNYIYKGGFPYGELLYVNWEDPVEVGDTVVLRSPKDKSIPAFVIGKVIAVEKKQGFFKKVLVKPDIDVRRLEFVYVLDKKL
ncbi:rod shape-determining protein MreC [Thermocrinis minervae]|uniref:rod shape-determining protein MreC n=1 Tax=Thermocrinis minervae TaxID=381751 RepID=UPI0015607BDB|nr:rod shape-determining protein MreC [Thermocrinis minervae]